MNIRKVTVPIYKKIVKVLSGRKIGSSYFVKTVHGLIFPYVKSDFAKIQGHKMFLDPKDSLGLSIFEAFEPFETEVIKEKIKEGDVVLDIGAHIGYYTLIFAKIVGKKGKVFAFEPSPDNFSLLKKNVEINGYKNVELIQKAVSNKTGKAKLYLCEDNSGDNRIYDSHDGRRFVEIETIRLDDYFKNYTGLINFIKMDTQGAEGKAIKGMTNLIKKNKNIKIVTEFWPFGLKKFGTNPKNYLMLLKNFGFSLYEIEKEEGEIKPSSISELTKKYIIPQNDNFANLLCIKKK